MVMLALALAYAGPHFPPPGPPAWKGGPPPHAAVLAHAQAHNPHFGGEALDGLDNDGDGLIDNLLFADADAVLRAPEGSRLTHMHSVGALAGNAGDGLVIASQDGLAFIAIEATQDGALADYPVLYGASIGRSAARVGGTVLIGEPDADVVHHMDATTLEPLAVQTGVRGFGSALSAWDDRYWAAGASKSGQVQLFDATGSLVRTVSRPHSQLADLGYAVAVGDLLHGDDVPDLVFGGPTSSDPKPGENKGTGVAYVLGASGACSWVWGGGQCQLIYGEIGPARVGHALEAMADVTADGHSDWLAGAPDYYGQGLVTVKAGGTIPDAHNGLASFASTRLWGAPDSFLGASISAGDINGDGVDDFVAGAPGLGQAQVVLSDGDALPTGDVTASATVDSGYDAIPVEPFFLPGTVTPNPQRVYPEEAFDAAHAVALFDADGDGYDDLAVLAHDAVYVFLSRF